MSTNAESFGKDQSSAAEILGGICRFLPPHPKGAVITLVICEVTGRIFVKFEWDVAKILPLNIFESEWRYCNLLWNAAVLYKCRYPNFF